jgi:sugar lactone lactonase YvrE
MPYPPRIPVGQTGPIRRTPRWPLAVVAAAAVVLVAGVLVPVLTGPTTIAGGPAPVEGPAPGTSTATLGPDLNAMTFDADGNLYLALRDTSTIKKLTPDGKLTTVVGGNGEGFAGDGGPATKAKIDYPHGLVVDADGNLLIADSSNERIRRVDRKGVITTVAGTGKPGGTGDSGPATKAQLDAPVGLAIGPRGDLYIAEADGNRVRRIDGGGRITTVAGTGVEGFAGDGGLAAQAELSLPLAVAVHGDDLYIADANNSRVRRVDGTGKISTVAGNGQEDSEGDGELATAASMDGPADVTVAPDGTLYIADPNANRIRRVSPDGLMATVAGTGVAGFSGEGGPAAKAQIAGPNAVAVGADGAVYIGDTLNQRVRRIAPNGVFDTVVGKGHDYPGDGLKAPKADLLEPQAARRGPDGATYIADSGNQRVRRVGKDGVISTVAGTGVHGFAGDGGKATDAELAYPTGLDWGSDGTLYIADSGNDRIRAVSKDGVIKTVAGGGTGGDGRADQAGLTSPVDLEVADDGTIYLAEDSGARIRRIGTDGILTTVAGTGEAGYSGDGGPATQAQLNEPTGVHIGRDGSLYVSDFGNSRVRRIDGGGVITTFAGNGTEGFAGDGGPAVDAELIGPYTVATAGDGSLYIADNNSHRVRRVDTNGVITTAVGNGDDGVPDDGDAAGRTMMATPAGLSVTPNGTLLITDIGNDQVYSVGGDGTVHVVAGAT